MNQYMNYKKWRLSRLNVNANDPLEPRGLVSSSPESLYHPDIGDNEKVPITKEHVDNYPTQFGPHVLGLQDASQEYINRLLDDLKYIGVTKEGSAFPAMYFSSEGKEGDKVYRQKDNVFLPRKHVDNSTPLFPTYAGLVVYNALKYPSHNDFSSYIDQSEEENPSHEQEFTDLLDMERNNFPFRNEDNIFYGNNIPKPENQPNDEYHNKLETYRKLMGHIASRRYLDYMEARDRGTTRDSFADYLEKITKGKTGNRLYDLLLDKLTSMAKGEHLK